MRLLLALGAAPCALLALTLAKARARVDAVTWNDIDITAEEALESRVVGIVERLEARLSSASVAGLAHPEVLEVVATTMQPATASVWIREEA